MKKSNSKILLLFFICFLSSVLAQPDSIKIIDYVNPFIGTKNGGNTFPGALVPWGMISLSPHNNQSSPSGYIKGEKYFYGFGSTHLSGTGCSDLGSIIISAFKKASTINPEEYRSDYSNEKASPGYYSLFLPGENIFAEATTTSRCGLIRFKADDSMKVLIDAGRSLGLIGGGYIKIVSDNEIEGYNISGGFCGEENRQSTYFTIRFNKKISDSRTFIDNNFVSSDSTSIVDTPVGSILSFKMSLNDSLLLKIGISYVSVENARENLNAELPDWDFNSVRDDAENLWGNYLSRIIVEGDEKNKIKFYTALYHMLIHPNIISDVNGGYPLMGRKGIGKNTDRQRYTVFSLWDTYRTLHPFLTLVYPEIQSEIMLTMLDMFKESGYLPKWELAGNETYMMVGDPAAPVIADSYLKGIRDIDTSLLIEAVTKAAILRDGEKAPPVRAGYHQVLKYGYIPFEQDRNEDWWVWGPVSTTLEYCFSDWTISQLAMALGKDNLFRQFLDRSMLYKNLFDRESMFIRPKLKNGEWMEPFNPLETEGSGDWDGSGGPGYVEGNAWNYTWFVPHDIEGLIDLFRGEERFSLKLQKAFSEGHFTINNEPDISYPYLFTYLKGKESISRKIISEIIDKEFGIDASGLPGNDDCGTISGWLVFSALGFYPACPGSNEYRIGVPLFDRITIQLSKDFYSGSQLNIIKKSNVFSSIIFNGGSIGYSINHSLITSGGELIFK